MILADYEAVSRGLSSIAQARHADEATNQRRAELRTQLEAQEKHAADERELRMALANLQLERSDRDRTARELEAKAKLEADAIRQFGKNWDAFGDYVRKETDPVTQLGRVKARRELDAMGGLPPPHANAGLADEVTRLELEKKKGELTQGSGAPVAKVTQSFGPDGKSRAQFNVPLDEFKRTAGAAGYRSPYAEDIAELGRKIAEQQAEQDGGDLHTGFLNLTSRKTVVDEATRKKRRLQALELQDMLAKGVIDQTEADRRASVILGGAAK